MDPKVKISLICLLIVGILLTVILVPLAFSYLEYYEYGLVRDKTSGTVESGQVYTRGRYMLGVTKGFLTYQADAHHERLEDLTVFSSGDNTETVGLVFTIDVDFTFFLKQEEISDLHKDLASSYRSVIVSRATDAIKNEAIYIPFNDYFQERRLVEKRFRDAVQKRWETQPSVHCTLDQFHMGGISIPESVANKQLESRVQSESNDKEAFLQRAQIEREQTAVEANSIMLESDNVLRTANAEASLLTSRANSTAKQMITEAQFNGTKTLLQAAGIRDEDDMTSLMYIRTLANRASLDMEVSYLTPESVVRTRAA
jgi:hypothetical protein